MFDLNFKKYFFTGIFLLFQISLYAVSTKELIDNALQEKKPEFQLILLTKAIDNSEKEPLLRSLALFNRGVLFFKKQTFDLAAKDFEEALKYKPDDIDILKNAGLTYDRLGLYKRGVEKFDQIIDLFPDLDIGYFNRANINAHHKLYSKAIKDYTWILQKSPFNYNVRANRGWSYLNLKQYVKALNDFDKVLQIDKLNEAAIEGKKQIKKALDLISQD